MTLMTTATAHRAAAPVSDDKPDDWRAKIGSGACRVGLDEAGLL
jgi:hypothetical protein